MKIFIAINVVDVPAQRFLEILNQPNRRVRRRELRQIIDGLKGFRLIDRKSEVESLGITVDLAGEIQLEVNLKKDPLND